MLSEGGASISSGERQLISIARAFARNPQLILFDEATSYIDSATELAIQQAVETLMKNRTSLVVAHRLSTVRNAHRIIVLHRGRIIETGRPCRADEAKRILLQAASVAKRADVGMTNRKGLLANGWHINKSLAIMNSQMI